jgi:hypothetical protein
MSLDLLLSYVQNVNVYFTLITVTSKAISNRMNQIPNKL